MLPGNGMHDPWPACARWATSKISCNIPAKSRPKNTTFIGEIT